MLCSEKSRVLWVLSSEGLGLGCFKRLEEGGGWDCSHCRVRGALWGGGSLGALLCGNEGIVGALREAGVTLGGALGGTDGSVGALLCQVMGTLF